MGCRAACLALTCLALQRVQPPLDLVWYKRGGMAGTTGNQLERINAVKVFVSVQRSGRSRTEPVKV